MEPTINNDACIVYNVAPSKYHMSSEQFEEIWKLRPEDQQQVKIFGKEIPTPRRYNVYGVGYSFSGQHNVGEQNIPEILKPFFEFGNSVLINYYANGEDYIGYHSDNEKALVKNQLIHCFSYGAERKFKFKHKKTDEVIDLVLPNNSHLIMKEHTQENWKHSLPVMKRVIDRRISITIRNMKNTF
jgi:alkylated DNA repair dioxygenase AlkB